VDFKPDDGLVLGEGFGRESCNYGHRVILSTGAVAGMASASHSEENMP